MKFQHAQLILAGAMAFHVIALQAADISIRVNGKVVAKPCTVSTTNVNVDLGNIYTFNLVKPGSASEWQYASLNLSNCPIGTSRIVATFTGNADSTGYYKNLGTAGHIQVEVQDEKGKPLNNGAQKEVLVEESSQAATFPLQVRALTVNGGATQGTIQAVINVTYTFL